MSDDVALHGERVGVALHAVEHQRAVDDQADVDIMRFCRRRLRLMAPDIAAVDRRVRRHRRRRLAFGSLATVIIMAMVAVPLALLSGLGGGSRTPAASPASRISCARKYV